MIGIIIDLNMIWSGSFFGEVIILLVVVVDYIVLGCVDIGFSILLQLTLFYKLLFALGSWSLFPSAGICLSVHDNSFCFTYCSMITWSDFSSCHLSNTDGNGLSLSGHDHNLFSNIDSTVVSQDARNHELSSITYGVDRWILDDDSF